MDEDVLGPRQTVIGTQYGTCERCGDVVPRAQLSPAQATTSGPLAPPDAQSDPAPLLCPTCTREVGSGEPFELDDDGRADTQETVIY